MPQSKLAKWFPGRVAWVGRSRAKLSQSEVGRFLGKNYQSVAKLEQGKVAPSVGDCYALADLFKLSDELRDYMIDIARNEAQQNFQTDRRFNALCLQMGELSNGEILKWEPFLVPGIAQTRDYHFNYVKVASNGTTEQANRGWSFKKERIEGLLERTDNPKVRLLIGEAALYNLRVLSESQQREQIEQLQRLSSVPNWEIRVVTSLYPEGATAYEIYRPESAEFGSPPFVYTEIWDSSWCIEEPGRIARYDELWKILLGKSTSLKEYLDDRRDGLAQKHP